MRQKDSFLIVERIIHIIILINTAFYLVACGDIYSTVDTSKVNLTGKWQYEQITSNPETQEFITSHYHVNLVDDSSTVSLQHCTKLLDTVLNRSEDILINELGQKLHIVDEDTIESVTVPDLRKLTRMSSDGTAFHNAGSVSLQGNNMPLINTNADVCAQRIQQTGSDKINLRISIPFETSFMEIELEINDIKQPDNNIDRMTFYSPLLTQYYDFNKLETLFGHAIFSALDNERITLDFDITTVLFSTFSGDNIKGHIDVHL